MDVLSPPWQLERGDRLGRYVLLAPLARGGMGTVWVACPSGRPELGASVAIKAILADLAFDDRYRAMFLDEARIASRLRHPNIARVYDLAAEGPVLYIVMEYVHGLSLLRLHELARRQSHTTIPVGCVLRAVADACSAFHSAHELRGKSGASLHLVHRDATPDNILVDDNGVVKVIDFGIAKARERIAADTSSGFLKGKVRFSPPELARNEPLDRRADIWSLGATLYFLLAGRHPYDAPTDAAVLARIASGKAPSPLPSEIPSEVAEIVGRALAPAVESRYPTARALGDALSLALERLQVDRDAQDLALCIRAFGAHELTRRARALQEAWETAMQRVEVPSESSQGAAADGASLSRGESSAPQRLSIPQGRAWLAARRPPPSRQLPRGTLLRASAGIATVGALVVAAAFALPRSVWRCSPAFSTNVPGSQPLTWVVVNAASGASPSASAPAGYPSCADCPPRTDGADCSTASHTPLLVRDAGGLPTEPVPRAHDR